MNTSTAEEPKTTRGDWLPRMVRFAGFVLLGGVLLLMTLWAVAALHFDVRVSWLRTPLAVG